MRTVGLDISTHCGMALIGPGQEVGKVINFPGMQGFQRVQSIASEVGRTLQIWGPGLVLIEGYAFANQNTLVTLVEIGTAVRLVLRSHKIPWMTCPPSVLKKWTTGVGNAKKDQMAAKVYERWGFKSPSDDIVDAYALAQLAQLPLEKLLAVKGVVRES